MSIRHNSASVPLNRPLRIPALPLKEASLWYPYLPIIVDLDLTETYTEICCKPNHNIFEIIHSFLSNPFFQINEYICPPEQSQNGFKASLITLPTIGILEMNHTVIQYPQCQRGRLGLSKQSTFLNYLPINDHTVKF